jgi:hypothetical protein
MPPRCGGPGMKGNNSERLDDNRCLPGGLILNSARLQRSFTHMAMHRLISFALASGLIVAAPARAECFADYKAKQDSPLRLHYGVAQIPDGACDNRKAAASALAPRLANDGWTLLNILSIFGPDGLEQRKGSAGQYFLRY